MSGDRGKLLIAIARSAISEALGISLDGFVPPAPDAEWLQERGACFVTLKLDESLRGCIGSLEAYRPLLEDLHANAVNAAFHDPRFPPLTAGEFSKVRIEVSLLGPLEPLPPHSSEEAIIAMLRPGTDGIVFSFGPHRATFLPQVWEQLPEPHSFLAHLKLKAGLPPDFWHDDVLISRYQVHKFDEAPATE